MDPLTITTGIITLYSAVWQLERLKNTYINVPEKIKSLNRDCDETLSIILHTKYRLDWHDRHPTPDDFINPIDIREEMRKIIALLQPEVEMLKAELTALLRWPETNWDNLKSKILKARHVHNLETTYGKIKASLDQFDRLLRSMDGENIDFIRKNSWAQYNLLNPTPSVTSFVISAEGTKLLLDAITSGRQKDVKIILRLLGVNPNFPEEETGLYPIHVATERCDLVMMEELLKCGAKPDAQDKDGKTALHVATKEDTETAVELLLRYQANPNAEDQKYRTPLWYAARNGDSPKTFQVLIQSDIQGIDVVNYRCEDPYIPTALWAAASSHSLSRFKALLQAGARTEGTNIQGDTLLHQAEWPIATAMVPLLLGLGADFSAQDRNGKLPLHRAAATGKITVVEALLECMEYSSVNEQDGEGATALIRGAQRGSLPLVRCLTKKWRAKCSVQDHLGNRAFSYACGNGHILIVSYLLGLGTDIDAANKQGDTPLHLAAKSGHAEIVKLLIQLGAQGRELVTEVARTAGHEDIARMIETLKPDD